MNRINKQNQVIFCISFACANMAIAQSSSTQKTETTHHKLDEIVVYAEQNTGLSSTQVVKKEDIERQPANNGNIADYLKSDPHIRFENSDESNFQRGEIKPEAISINGAESNQTSYFVDNVNVNNDLGFDSELFDGAMATVPQSNHAQAYFFDANLLSSITVHDSDISASLGGFAGGAVVAKTKQYNGKDSVKLRYRTTNSGWAKFHIDEKDRAKFEKAAPEGASADYQPKYNKHFFSLSAEQRLTDNLGVVFGVSRRGSHIQQERLISPKGETDKRDHTRRSDNALVNFNYTPNDQHRFEWGLRYSNYRESKFYATNIDSDIRDYHQAYGTTLSWLNALNSSVLTTTIAYDYFRDKRHSASTHMEIEISDDGDSYDKGGMGDSQLTQQNLHSSVEYAINPFDWGEVNHSISLGSIYQFTRFAFNRAQDATSTTKISDSIVFSNNVKAGTVKTRYQNIALYAEDLISWKNLEIRPGIRLERDDFLKNTNIAPRFVMHWKPFEETTISLGANRYYGRSFASMKLTEGIFKLDGHDAFRYQNVRDFKTPYANELSFGIEQHFGNMAMNAKYIHRQNRNRIVLTENQDEKKRYYTRGEDYSADVYTLQFNNIEPLKWRQTYWQGFASLDWLRMQALNLGRGYDGNAPVILDGKLMNYAEMRKKVNNNREEWMVRLGLDMQIPDLDLTWSNKWYIKAPIKGANQYGELKDIPLYRSYDYGTHTQWDTSLRWSPKVWNDQRIVMKVDVLNVLNKTRKGISSQSGADYGFYTAGREFWLELGYEF